MAAETRQPLNPPNEMENMADSFFRRVYTGEQSVDEVGLCWRRQSLTTAVPSSATCSRLKKQRGGG